MENIDKILLNNILNIIIEYLTLTENYYQDNVEYSIQKKMASIIEFCTQASVSMSTRLLGNIIVKCIVCDINEYKLCEVSLISEFENLVKDYIKKNYEKEAECLKIIAEFYNEFGKYNNAVKYYYEKAIECYKDKKII